MRLVRPVDALAPQFEEAQVYDGALVIGAAAVVDLDYIGIVGIAVAVDALKIVAAAQRAGGRVGPRDYHLAVVVGCAEVALLARVIVVDTGDSCGTDQPPDHGRERWWAVAPVLFPPFLPRQP